MDRYKIRVYNNVKGQFPLEKYEVKSSLDMIDPDAILLRSEKLHDIPMPQNVLAIARAGAGTDNVPIDACSKKGIVVFNTPGANANAVKELVICAIICASRNVIPAVTWLDDVMKQQPDASSTKKIVENMKKLYKGNEISGKTILVIGLGSIGALVASSLAALGMKVIGFDPYLKAQQALKLPSTMNLIENLAEGVAKADFITIHTELTPDTAKLINTRLIEIAPKNCKIINFARAEIIDQAVLHKWLEQNKNCAYVSDFISEPFIGEKLPNAVFLPHLGASTEESEENCAEMAVSQLKNFLENGNIVNSKNFPTLSKDWESAVRLLIANENIPGQIAATSNIISQAGLNIAGMANSSKGQIAYNIIDLDLAAPKSLVDQLVALPHILRIRTISK